MRLLVVCLFVFTLHIVTATVDIYKIKQTVATKLQNLEDNAARTLQNLHSHTARKFQTLQDKASESFHQFVDTIDFEKLKSLDVLDIIPKLQRKGQFIHQTVKSLPEYKNKVWVVLKSAKSLTGEDLLQAFDTSEPWPAKRLDAIGIKYLPY